MIYSGKALSVDVLPSGIANLVFNLEGSSVNKFDQETLGELQQAIAALQKADVPGLVLSSAKKTFIVGADITEFTSKFAEGDQQVHAWLVEVNKIFSDLEDLPVPHCCGHQWYCTRWRFRIGASGGLPCRNRVCASWFS